MVQPQRRSPSATKRTMAYGNGIITSPVSIYDVQQALGNSSPDLGTLCKASQINKWAKYKPETVVTGLVTYDIQPITLASRKLNGYGLRMRSNLGFGSISSLVTALRNGTVGESFDYIKPSGGINSAYRQTDFDNYWHNAPCPITFPYVSTDRLAVTAAGNLQLYYYVNIDDSTFGIGLSSLRIASDSYTMKDYYFGILIYNSSSYYAATQNSVMGNGNAEGIDVTLIGVSQTPSTYTMIPFFSSLPITSQSAPFTGTIYPMTFASGEITTAAESSYIIINVYVYVWTNDMSTLRMRYSVVNQTSGAQTFSTTVYGEGTSYVTIGNSQQTGTYLYQTISVSVNCPANQTTEGDIVIKSDLLSAQQDFIRNGDTYYQIRAHRYNSEYFKTGIIEMWEPE